VQGETFLKHQIAIRRSIAHFAQFALERKAKNLWRIDETHAMAGIFLTVAKRLGSDLPTRKELSRYGELRESRDRALKKCRSERTISRVGRLRRGGTALVQGPF
jgi:hypothetical protein